jgi:hypothetical protein
VGSLLPALPLFRVKKIRVLMFVKKFVCIRGKKITVFFQPRMDTNCSQIKKTRMNNGKRDKQRDKGGKITMPEKKPFLDSTNYACRKNT